MPWFYAELPALLLILSSGHHPTLNTTCNGHNNKKSYSESGCQCLGRNSSLHSPTWAGPSGSLGYAMDAGHDGTVS